MKDLVAMLDRCVNKRLLVVGDLMLDRYIWGEAERVSPEAPVLVLREDLDEVRPGGAANVASLLRGLDVQVILTGIVGNDPEGRTLRRLMTDLSIDDEGILVDPDRQTTIKQRFVGRAAQRQPHQILRVDRESRTPLSESIEHQLIERVFDRLSACDAVLISDYAKGVCTPSFLRKVIDAARGRSIPVLIDPYRGKDFQRYSRATLITPNRIAAEQAMGMVTESAGSASPSTLRNSSSIEQAARQLRERLRLDAVVITLDRDGLGYAIPGASGVVPCRSREVCDVTGAGDMVLAVLGLCLGAGLSLVDSLPVANIAAGLEVERFGVEPVTRTEILAEFSHHDSRSSKVQSLDAVAHASVAYRRTGRKIVFTNGCFDLLHVGHLSLLEDAARLGDILIVAINSDASVRKLKGPERPIINENDRARMLAALVDVDHVVIFDDDTPHRLLEAIRPDILVKGGTTGHIVGREIVEAYGGRVVWTPTIPGLSTTDIVRRMQSRESAERIRA